MKKLLMILGASLFMMSCGGDCEKKCEGKKECSKECSKDGHKEKCEKDCKKACCSKDEAHEGHGDEKHACEPGCTKACCAHKDGTEESTDSTSTEVNGEETTIEEEITETVEVLTTALGK